jgi:hypothetical protein
VVRTPEHQFIVYLVKLFGKLPDDPFYENINAYLRAWLYESWIYEQEKEAEKERNQAILIGSFSNLEMAQKMIRADNPNAQSTDLDETTKMVREKILEADKVGKGKRKKRKVV